MSNASTSNLERALYALNHNILILNQNVCHLASVIKESNSKTPSRKPERTCTVASASVATNVVEDTSLTILFGDHIPIEIRTVFPGQNSINEVMFLSTSAGNFAKNIFWKLYDQETRKDFDGIKNVPKVVRDWLRDVVLKFWPVPGQTNEKQWQGCKNAIWKALSAMRKK